jgi:hypothetical protein
MSGGHFVFLALVNPDLPNKLLINPMNLKTVKTLGLISFVLVLGIAVACIKHVIPTPPPPGPSVTLKSGLLLYLPFDGNIADSSGNNNATAIINTVDSGGGLTTDANGKANSAWGSNGTGTYIKVTNNGSSQYDSSFSLSFNVMVNVNNYVRQSFVSDVNTTTSYGPGFAAGLSVPGSLNYCFGVDDTTAGCGNNNGGNLSNVADTANFIPQTGVWYHVVNVYQQGTLYVYVNGQLTGGKTNLLNHSAQDCPQATINVGYWWDQDKESLNGKIDEIRLYNRSLTIDEISALANN